MNTCKMLVSSADGRIAHATDICSLFFRTRMCAKSPHELWDPFNNAPCFKMVGRKLQPTMTDKTQGNPRLVQLYSCETAAMQETTGLAATAPYMGSGREQTMSREEYNRRRACTATSIQRLDHKSKETFSHHNKFTEFFYMHYTTQKDQLLNASNKAIMVKVSCSRSQVSRLGLKSTLCWSERMRARLDFTKSRDWSSLWIAPNC